MLTTHLLHAGKEPLPRSGDPRRKESVHCLQTDTGTQEDARLVSLRVKKVGGGREVVRPFLELLGPLCYPCMWMPKDG